MCTASIGRRGERKGSDCSTADTRQRLRRGAELFDGDWDGTGKC